MRIKRPPGPGLPVAPGTVLDRVDRRLIGEGHRLGQQRGLQVVFEPVKAPGQPPGDLVDPPGRDVRAEQPVDHLGGALLAELPEGMAQQRGGRQVRPVAHRGADRALRRVRPGHRAAPAAAGNQQVLGDQRPYLGDIDDLQRLAGGLHPAGQITAAAPALARLQHDLRVGGPRERQAVAVMPVLSAALLLSRCLALGRLVLRRSRCARRRSARVPGPSEDGGLEEFCESRPVLAINSDTSWSRASIFASCASARAWSAAIRASFAASRARPSLINAA